MSKETLELSDESYLKSSKFFAVFWHRNKMEFF